MFENNNELLQKPTGVDDLLPDNVKKYKVLKKQIIETFKLWGYEEVSVPTLEYPELFRESKGKSVEREMFQFSDNTGRPIVLRPDFTPSIARLIATYFNKKPRPIRLCYSGKVYKLGHSMSQEKELNQIGVELVGDGAALGDAEIVAMAVETLKNLGIEDFVICIGNMNFIDSFLSEIGLSNKESKLVKETLNENDLVKYYSLTKQFDISEKARDLLHHLPKFRGKKEALVEVKQKLQSFKAVSLLEELEVIFVILEGYNLQDKVTFDLSLVRKFDYYTGFIIEGYSKSIGFPLCGGGRYDNLMSSYGKDLSATGFAFSFDTLMKLMPEKFIEKSPTKVFLSSDKKSLTKALANVRDLREEGYQVIVDLEGISKEDALERAKEHSTDELYYYYDNNFYLEKI
ncbi:ATP phosphoribosyltransferase regulatory subunit [Natranaerobius trueperi]|uniref:ATP phosphoribosyltransferase regulatory subunit n=1 Tax=Natranaerobius trueperi TaxID=759412 RepID=UPI001303D0FA|nr:ATP phosphoribosyltransferase regulatory subunit [Natranaerobius trueperi]